MKLPLSVLTICTVLTAAGPAPAQVFTLTNSAGATAPTSAAKGKPLGTTEKKFVKDSTDSLYFMLEMVGQAKKQAKTDPVKQLTGKMKKDFDKVWADVATYATARGESIPTELKGADKIAAERLKQAEEQSWDKEFLKLADREAKKLVRTFDSSKAVQDADLKKIADKWLSAVNTHSTALEQAEKDFGKR